MLEYLPLSPTSSLFLLALLGHVRQALTSEVCMLLNARDYLVYFVRCVDYCCKYTNGSQYCCDDCKLSINSDSCAPGELWRYILYVGLGIAGSVVLCYLIVYVVKNCKERMKRACCKERTSRVQDPGISLTSTSAWIGARPSHPPPPSLRFVESSDIADEEERLPDVVLSRWAASRYPQTPPSYTAAAAAAAAAVPAEDGTMAPPPRAAATSGQPPPMYSEVAPAPRGGCGGDGSNGQYDNLDSDSYEAPPAYAEALAAPGTDAANTQ